MEDYSEPWEQEIQITIQWLKKVILTDTIQPVFTCSKLTIETLEQGVNFEHISHLVLVFLLLTWSK